MEFKSYDQIEEIACKGCRADQIKQTIQENDKVKCYETNQDANIALNQEKTITEKLGRQITLRLINETEPNQIREKDSLKPTSGYTKKSDKKLEKI